MGAGNVFEVHGTAEAFLAAWREALPSCRRRLWVQFSTFEGDAAGEAVAELLLDRVDAGCEVRLSVDHYSNVVLGDMHPLFVHRRAAVRDRRVRRNALLRRLEGAGVVVRHTAPPGVLGRYLLYRDHKKLVVLDDVAFVGGLNVSDHNFVWNDFMVAIRGPLVADLAHDFESTWQGCTVPIAADEVATDVVVNQCAGRPAILEEVLDMISSARESVAIESPYLIGDRIEGALLAAARRGVQVTLLVPSRPNRWIVRVWYRKMRRRLTHPNIAIHGYEGDPVERGMTHAKLCIVDGERATFGSFNFFELESLTQKELNVFTHDSSCIRQLEELLAEHLAASAPLPRPSSGFGRFTYTAVHALFDMWTKSLLTRSEWKATYC